MIDMDNHLYSSSTDDCPPPNISEGAIVVTFSNALIFTLGPL